MALQSFAGENPLPLDRGGRIIQKLWPRLKISPLSYQELESWRAYFRHYTTEARNAIEWEGGRHTTVRKHQDIVSIAECLERGDTKGDLKGQLCLLDTQNRTDQAKRDMAEGSIRLVVRLFSMVDIGPIARNQVPNLTFVSWADETSDLRVTLHSYFRKSCQDPEKKKFDTSFSAYNIQRLAGIEVLYTNNLAEHLRLVENNTKLWIFHHATFLRWQDSAILPVGLVDETLRTLELLFPCGDSKANKWLESQVSAKTNAVRPDPAILKLATLAPDFRGAEKFEFWRDELLTLKERFEEQSSTSITRFWFDRRNKVQWATFWVAMLILGLTVFFGLIQSIEGALQVYKAYFPTQ